MLPIRITAIVSIKAGSFDDRSWLRPVGNLWTRSKQPGVNLDGDLHNYETEPEDFYDLEAAWAKFASDDLLGLLIGVRLCRLAAYA